jgi:hypothetical protein
MTSDHDAFTDQVQCVIFSSNVCTVPLILCSVPTEFTSIHFPVKALKIIVRDLLSGGESATLNAGGEGIEEVDSDDGVSNFNILIRSCLLTSY